MPPFHAYKARLLALVVCSFGLLLPVQARPIVGLTDTNELVFFDSTSPQSTATVAVQGLAAGDSLHAIDYRPANGALYGLAINGSGGTVAGRIYVISFPNLVATPVGSEPFSTTLPANANYGFDFQPQSDRIHIVTDADDNLFVDPDTGALVATGTKLEWPNTIEEVVAIAYDRADRNPGTATTLFGIEYQSDSVVRIGGVNGVPPASGGLVSLVGDTGETATNRNIAFDIDDTGIAYASIPTGSPTIVFRLYTVNLDTGDATVRGPIGGAGTGKVIRGLAVRPRPVTNANTFEVFETIQAAIDDSNTDTGHSIDVSVGPITESVTVSKAVVLRGGQAGVDPNGTERTAAFETTISGAFANNQRRTPFNVTVDGVTIDGFRIQDSANTTELGVGAAIRLAPGTSGAKIRNNIISNNVSGITLSGDAPKIQTVIERNLISGNNKPGPASGVAIFSDEVAAGGPLRNVLINENTFLSNSSAAVYLESNVAGSQSRVVISNNVIFGNGHGIVLVNTADSAIARNTLVGSVSGPNILIAGGVDGLSISENFIEGGSERGIRINNFAGGANANLILNCNSIDNNAIAGLQIDSGGYTGSLDATGNWWGNATGPQIASNPGGTGQSIVDAGGQVNYSGFLTAAADQQAAAHGYQCLASAVLFGVDSANNLVRFDSAAPGTILSMHAITGLASGGESILGIDFRPTTGELFAIGSTNRLYVIDTATGAATLRAELTAAPGDDNPFSGFNGVSYGVDFNPVPDLAGNPSLRVTTSTDQNARVNVVNGHVITDNNINPDLALINAVAYRNVDLDPATGTSLFAYNFGEDTFVQLPAPNSGSSTVIGASGLFATGGANFDFQTAGSRNVPFLSLQISGEPTKLYTADLTHGLLIPLGTIGNGVTLSRGMAVAPRGHFQFAAASYEGQEAEPVLSNRKSAVTPTVASIGPAASITIARVGGSEGSASVVLSTQDGTATAPDDYTATTQVVHFAPGQTTAVAVILITGDSLDEPDETVNLSLSDPANGASLAPLTSAVLTIIDKPTPAVTITTSPSTTPGKQLTGAATISSSNNVTGTITFSLYGPDDVGCAAAPIFTSTVPVNGNGTYTSEAFTPSRTGTYQFVVSYSGDGRNNAVAGACGDANAAVAVTPATALANIATRLLVQPGDNVLIGGITITGTLPKRMLVRAIGPSLDVAGALPDPQLQLYAGDELVTANDNWRDVPNQQEIIDTTLAPPDDRESAILITLNPGQYTAVVSGVNGESGVGLVDAYDLDRTVDSKFANIATRGLVQTGVDVMIGGLIILGDTTQDVLVRAIGPSLPVEGKLGDPTLELVDANGETLATNNNWRDDQQAAIEATTIPPSDDLESAIRATLPPAQYTAIVRGFDGGTGVGLVEVYALD